MRKLLWILIGLSLIITSCAKANDPMVKSHKLVELTRYPTQGEPLNLDVDNNLVFSAEDNGGFRVYDKNSGTVKFNLELYNDSDIIFAKNIKVHPESHLAILHNRNVNGLLYTIDYSNPDSVYVRDYDQGQTNRLNDILIIDEPATSDFQFSLYKAKAATEGEFTKIVYVKIKNNNMSFNPEKDIDIPYSPICLSHLDNHLFVGASFLGIYVYNLANVVPGSLADIYDQRIDTPGEVADIEARGNYLYVADKQAGFHIVKLNADKSGAIIKTFLTTGNASNVALSDNYAAVSSGSGGVYLFNIANPENAFLVDNLALSEIGYVNNVHFDDDGILYVMSRDQGVIKFRIN